MEPALAGPSGFGSQRMVLTGSNEFGSEPHQPGPSEFSLPYQRQWLLMNPLNYITGSGYAPSTSRLPIVT